MSHKVLIVDDDATVRQLIAVALREYDLVVGTNGQEALKLIAREKPELILLDVMMPKMNGFEVVERLKADPATADIPIIMLTARGDRSTLEQGQAVGVSTYITKPFSPRKLSETVSALLRKKGESFP
ncbi:MAG: PleD family two-component system response regulator [Nitrospiria bacterium]